MFKKFKGLYAICDMRYAINVFTEYTVTEETEMETA